MNDRKFNQLLWDFSRDLRKLRNFKDDTVKTYISCIIKYRDYAGNTLNINLLDSAEENLFDFIIDLSKTTSSGRISHFTAALRRFFKMLFLYKEIAKNPARNLIGFKREKSTRYKHIPADIIFKMFKAIDNLKEKNSELREKTKNRDKMMLLLLWTLGLRSLEMRSIRKEHIKILDKDKKQAVITIDGKGAKQRTLLIMDKLCDCIIRYIQPLKENDLLFPGKPAKTSSDERSRIMDDSTVNKRIKKYLKAAGVKMHFTAHSLRHSFATEMYYQNVPLDAIMTMLGHDNLKETARYIHVSREDMIDSLSNLTIKGL